MDSLFCNVVQGIAESNCSQALDQSCKSGAGKMGQWVRAPARVALLET